MMYITHTLFSFIINFENYSISLVKLEKEYVTGLRTAYASRQSDQSICYPEKVTFKEDQQPLSRTCAKAGLNLPVHVPSLCANMKCEVVESLTKW